MHLGFTFYNKAYKSLSKTESPNINVPWGPEWKRCPACIFGILKDCRHGGEGKTLEGRGFHNLETLGIKARSK